MYQLTFYVPVDHAERVKEAIFYEGAGKFNGYDKCSWQTLGQGQFRPLEGSNPYIGKQGELEFVEELKIETVCEDKKMKRVLETLLEIHPYEQPAYYFSKVNDIKELHLV